MTRAIIALTLVGLAALVATHLHTYAGLNAGVVIGQEGIASVGYETRGDPGPFVELGNWQWAWGQR